MADTVAGAALTAPMVITGERATVESMYSQLDSDRSQVLDAARVCAALTKPQVLPPREQNKNRSLPESYQSIGSRGANNIEGLMLVSLFDPSIPWFEQVLAPEIEYDKSFPPEQIQEMKQFLFIRSLMALACLNGEPLTESDNYLPRGFLTAKRLALSNIIITGETLERMDDDFNLTVFRRDRYVTKRNSCGQVLCHVVQEPLDPLSLTDEELSKTGLRRADLKSKLLGHRLVTKYTITEWQPDTNKWVVKDEVLGKTIAEREETISEFFCTPFELVHGEDYGRGLVEMNRGDLTSLNNTNKTILDWGAAYGKVTPVIDPSSKIRPKDLSKPSGEPIYGRVVNGKVVDVGFLTPENAPNFGVMLTLSQRLEANLAKSFLIGSEIQPRGERVTAEQIRTITSEVQGALGSVYAPIEEAQHLPMLRRTIHVMEKKNLIRPLPDKRAVRINVLTGIAALRREGERGKLLTLAQVIASLPKETLARVNFDVFLDAYMRMAGIYEPGLVKSREEMRREMQEAIALQARNTAAQKAIEVGGNVIENQLSAGSGQTQPAAQGVA